MVRLALLLVVALVAPAVAEPLQIASTPSLEAREYTRLGTRVAYAVVPLAAGDMSSYSLGVTYDRPVFGAWRVVGEYEYAWLGSLDGIRYGVAGLPASGHRLQAGVRRRLARHTFTPMFQLFLEADAGVGASILDDPRAGVIAPVHAFVGLHAGFSLVSLTQHACWDYDLVVRAQAFEEGVAGFIGVGYSWGN